MKFSEPGTCRLNYEKITRRVGVLLNNDTFLRHSNKFWQASVYKPTTGKHITVLFGASHVNTQLIKIMCAFAVAFTVVPAAQAVSTRASCVCNSLLTLTQENVSK